MPDSSCVYEPSIAKLVSAVSTNLLPPFLVIFISQSQLKLITMKELVICLNSLSGHEKFL